MNKKNNLNEAIYRSLKESINVNDYIMNPMGIEEKKRKSENDDSNEEDRQGNKKNTIRREKVLNYLKSAQQKHSEYAYHLWPDMEKDDARSLFSKKYRGHDADGNSYSFNDEEIISIYNMIDDVLNKTNW